MGDGQRWAESLQFLHNRIVQERPEAILNLDDDQLFTDDGLEEIAGHLAFFTEDRYEYQSLFLWDDLDHYNAAFPAHWSGNLFRVYRGDHWATNFVAHCPRACARSERVLRLKEPVINFGYMGVDDRVDAWTRSRRAGKIDAHTLALIREPDLKRIRWRSKERTLLEPAASA